MPLVALHRETSQLAGMRPHGVLTVLTVWFPPPRSSCAHRSGPLGLSLLGEYPDPLPSAFLDAQYVAYAVAFDALKRPAAQGATLNWTATLQLRTTSPTGAAPAARSAHFPAMPILRLGGSTLSRLAARSLIRQWEEDSDNPLENRDKV